MKKQNILLSLLVVACLTGCGSGQGGNSSSKQNNDKSKIVIEDFGTLKMEAEDFNLSGWEADESYDDNIIEEANASGGKYVAAAASGSAAEATFSIELKKFDAFLYLFNKNVYYSASISSNSISNTRAEKGGIVPASREPYPRS